MLTEEKANQLKVDSTYGTQLENKAFLVEEPIWKKKGILIQSHQSPFSAKRFEFLKIGRTLGLETKRYLAIEGDVLFYYDEPDSDKILGYCQLQNIYAYFLRTAGDRHMLYLTNGTASSQFFFENDEFLKHSSLKILRNVVQLDFNDKYVELDFLGQGSFSKVYLVRRMSNSKQYAAKIIPKRDKHNICTKKCVEEEKKIMGQLMSCQYIYKFEEFFEEEDNYILIIEYLNGKDLMSLIKEKTEFRIQQTVDLLRKILESIVYCHSKGVLHRDLKPQNIIVNMVENKPKLIDFGLSLLLYPGIQQDQFRRCGTMGYMAPEVVENTSDKRKPYDGKCDVFSFGIIAHMMLLGSNPLKGKSYEETLNNNKICKIDLDEQTIVEKYGESCLEFLSKCLSKSPRERPTASEAMEMSFFKFKENSESTYYKSKGLDSASCKQKNHEEFELESHQQPKRLLKTKTYELKSSKF